MHPEQMPTTDDKTPPVTLAQIGYEAYGFKAEWKTWDGKAMPTWADLGDVVRGRWQAAASAIIKASEDASAPVFSERPPSA